jgi:hypothetical protein
MKAVLLLWTIVVAATLSNETNAQPGNGCNQIINNINNAIATVNQNAASYWTDRANFVDLIYGPSSQVVPNAKQVAEQEKSQADTIKQGMPGRVNSLKGLLRAAQAQDCITPALQFAIVEPSVKQGKRVNFDQFPSEEQQEEPTAPGPPRMPLH